MLTSVIFRDGTETSVTEAAKLIGSETKSGRDLRARTTDGHVTWVFWRTYGSRLCFESSSGNALATVRIKRTSPMQFEPA